MEEKKGENIESQEANQEIKEDDMESLKAKVKELEDRYIRVHADFENTKKRLEKEKYQMIDYASEKFAKDLLPSLDSLDMAIVSTNKEGDKTEMFDKLKEGIALTLDNFLKIFSKHDIEAISTEGGFDPHLHEAIMQVASETHNEGEIVQVLQKGYKYKSRILRPALVSLCKK